MRVLFLSLFITFSCSNQDYNFQVYNYELDNKEYRHLIGRPCDYKGKLGNLFGYTKVGGCHIENLSIEYKDKLTVFGEIICKYDDFESFNNLYKNPRNFAAGSIRLLDANECAKRKLTFIAWDAIAPADECNSLAILLRILKDLSFNVVPFLFIDYYKEEIETKLAYNYRRPVTEVMGLPAYLYLQVAPIPDYPQSDLLS